MTADVADTEVSLAAGRWVVRHAPDWPDFAGADWLDTVMTADVPDREHRKQGRAIGRWTLTAPDGRQLVVFLKRHFELPRRHGLLARLFPDRRWSPGLQEWFNLRGATNGWVRVPRAVAAGEWRGPGGRLQSFIAIEELAGQLPLHEAIPLAAARLTPPDFERWKRGLVGAMAYEVSILHNYNGYHRDLYLCHFYLPEALTGRLPTAVEWSRALTLIDFHRFTPEHRSYHWLAAPKDLGQLLFSTLDVAGITARDRARFWRRYGRIAYAPSWLRRAAVRRAARYARHNAKRVASP